MESAGRRHYFNKEVADLSLGEAAALVGIVQAPNAYSPSAAGWEASLPGRSWCCSA